LGHFVGSFLVGGLLCLVGCFASNYLFSVQAPRPSTANMGKRIRAKSIWFSPSYRVASAYLRSLALTCRTAHPWAYSWSSTRSLRVSLMSVSLGLSFFSIKWDAVYWIASFVVIRLVLLVGSYYTQSTQTERPRLYIAFMFSPSLMSFLLRIYNAHPRGSPC